MPRVELRASASAKAQRQIRLNVFKNKQETYVMRPVNVGEWREMKWKKQAGANDIELSRTW